MNLFGLNISLSRRSAPPAEIPVSQLSPAALAWLSGSDPGPDSPVLSNAYLQVVWVYRAINVLAEQVANIPFLFSSGDGRRSCVLAS